MKLEIFEGNKNVYWSTTKIASHIRSGHCTGSSDQEVQRFKQEFVYETPKNLVHKSSIKESATNSNKLKRKLVLKTSDSNVKMAKLDVIDNVSTGDEQYIEEDNNEEDICFEEMVEEQNANAKVEVVYVSSNDRGFNYANDESAPSNKSQISMNKEEKFISMVYPTFKGKSKLELIDEINDLKRQNELLLIKNKTYESTINALLT